MKQFLAAFAVVALVAVGTVAPASAASKTAKSTQTAKAAVTTKPSYCGSGAWATSYRAVYEYPTGSYWVNQINAFPKYYAQNNAYFLANYGC